MITSIHMAPQVQAYLTGDVQKMLGLVAESVSQYVRQVLSGNKAVDTKSFDVAVSKIVDTAITHSHPDLSGRLAITVARPPECMTGRIEIKLNKGLQTLLDANRGACGLQ